MKKYLCVLVVSVLILTFTGCEQVADGLYYFSENYEIKKKETGTLIDEKTEGTEEQCNTEEILHTDPVIVETDPTYVCNETEYPPQETEEYITEYPSEDFILLENGSSEYYSNTLVISGGYAVHPAEGLFCIQVYRDGEACETGDGIGLSDILYYGEASPEVLPMLTLSSEVNAYGNSAYKKIDKHVYVLNKNLDDYSRDAYEWSELSSLEAGEYIIVYMERYDSRGNDTGIKDYETSVYECAFRLMVC